MFESKDFLILQVTLAIMAQLEHGKNKNTLKYNMSEVKRWSRIAGLKGDGGDDFFGTSFHRQLSRCFVG